MMNGDLASDIYFDETKQTIQNCVGKGRVPKKWNYPMLSLN